MNLTFSWLAMLAAMIVTTGVLFRSWKSGSLANGKVNRDRASKVILLICKVCFVVDFGIGITALLNAR